jgi:hypothetical protein
MELSGRLVEWDQLDLRVRGARAQQIVSEMIQRKQLPVSDLRLNFLDERLEVSAKIQKGLAIPVSFTVSTIGAMGSRLQIPLENVTTFGLVPVPKLLFRFVGAAGLPDGIRLDADNLVITVDLARFLPPFIDLEVQEIRIIPGGLAMRLGTGGADLPAVP